jgi:LuxR family maltose regulon positive regulatory protein
MPSTLLATKLHRPRPTPSLVARPRLTQRLDQGLRQGHRLFLVVAPAGYGKTTLVTDWLGQTSIPSAWLSLDEGDNDPLSFLTYLVAALQKAFGPTLGRPPLQGFQAMPQTPQAMVAPLINDLAALDRPVVLALDDYHVISTAFIQEAMVFLLEHAPPNLHLVVLTRADPPFPLPRLRVRDLMTEIRDRDLRFTPEEMTTFLNSLHGLNLPAEQITALESRTEGWAAGVQLAALSLEGCGAERAAQWVAELSGSHHYIVDYLLEEVVSRLPDRVRRFLLGTSVLDRLCAPLCDAVLGWEATGHESLEARPEGATPAPPQRTEALRQRSPAGEILEYLERANLFLVPLDDDRCWYRYHHLFADFLQQLARSAWPPDQVIELHRRASDWYGQNRLVAEAYHHALLAGHHQRAAQIVQDNAWSMVLRAELATLDNWVQALPGETLAERPWLRIYSAWASVLADTEDADRQVTAVEQQHRAGDPSQAGLPAEMQGHIAAIRAWIAYVRRDPERAAVLSRQALDLCPQIDGAVRSGLLTILGDGFVFQDDLPGAARAFTDAVELAHASGNVMLEVLGRTSLGSIHKAMGRLHQAEAIYQEALQTAIRAKSPVAGQAYACLARIYREWNDLAAARALADMMVESGALWGAVDTLACGRLFLATVLQAQGDRSGTDQAQASANEVFRQHPHEVHSLAWFGATQAKLWLAQGKLDEARRWAETRGLSEGGELGPGNEVEYLALVRILLAERCADQALRLLSRLQSTMEATGRHGDLVEVLVLWAIALDMRADAHAALDALAQAVSLARGQGHVRVFLDEGKPIETLLKTALARWTDRELGAYAGKLLAAFHQGHAERPPAPLKTPPGGMLIQPLSERELQVLRLVAAGDSNQEIADRLVISVRTVKKHVENIHGKLGVQNRTQAAVRARELELV